jgi:hypothetical protein
MGGCLLEHYSPQLITGEKSNLSVTENEIAEDQIL